MKRISGFIVAVTLLLGLTAGVSTQTALTQTTLSAAVTSVTANSIVVASATGFLANDIVFVDKEAMKVGASYVSGTTIPVIRGQAGTAGAKHASSAVVFRGLPSYFYQGDVVGPCTRTAEVALPHINVTTGNVFDCQNSTWNRWKLGGLASYGGFGVTAQTYTSIAVSAAITIQPGISFIGSGGALAMTLANPTPAQEGMIMIIEASTAQAHTVTYTAGFNGGTTARDVATFGGAIGDNMVIFATGSVWWVISTRNVTFG